MSPLLNPLGTDQARGKGTRRIILELNGGYMGDTFIEPCVAYFLTPRI